MHTLAAVARYAGVTPPTVRQWIEKGWLKASGPWTAGAVDAAAQRSRQRAGRGPQSAHGTASRWRAGCHCVACVEAHNADSRQSREAARRQWWEEREAPLVEAIRQGTAYREVLTELGISAQAVTAHRRRSETFARALDAALLEARDERLEHGTASGWRAGCRCPECRAHHEATRT